MSTNTIGKIIIPSDFTLEIQSITMSDGTELNIQNKITFEITDTYNNTFTAVSDPAGTSKHAYIENGKIYITVEKYSLQAGPLYIKMGMSEVDSNYEGGYKDTWFEKQKLNVILSNSGSSIPDQPYSTNIIVPSFSNKIEKILVNNVEQEIVNRAVNIEIPEIECIIEHIKVNGEEQEIVDKTVDIEIPTPQAYKGHVNYISDIVDPQEGDMYTLDKNNVIIDETEIQYPADTWRSITRAESQYLFKDRPNATNLRTIATVNNINGMILLPDDWICPTEISLTITMELNANVFDEGDWWILEQSGAIFLPASGCYRQELSRYEKQNTHCLYWTGSWWNKSWHHSATALAINVSAGSITPQDDWYISNGFSVRLVKDSNAGFSVSSTSKVIFSNGNMQYQPSTNKWRMANRQYASLSKFSESSEQEDWADFLSYGQNGYSRKPYEQPSSSADYIYKDISGDVWDWGHNEITAYELTGNLIRKGTVIVYKNGQFVKMSEPSKTESLDLLKSNSIKNNIWEPYGVGGIYVDTTYEPDGWNIGEWHDFTDEDSAYYKLGYRYQCPLYEAALVCNGDQVLITYPDGSRSLKVAKYYDEETGYVYAEIDENTIYLCYYGDTILLSKTLPSTWYTVDGYGYRIDPDNLPYNIPSCSTTLKFKVAGGNLYVSWKSDYNTGEPEWHQISISD